MTDRESFLAAIAAAPADDTPRLAFADWLEDHGDPARAGFIRDQVRLATLRPGTDEYRQLFRRTADTLRANLPAWIQSACDAFGQPAEWRPDGSVGSSLSIALKWLRLSQVEVKPGLTSIEFFRGFLDAAHIVLSNLRDPNPLTRLAAEHPLTRLSFVFPDTKSQFKDVVPSKLASVRCLSIMGMASDDVADSVFESSAWTGVTRLSLHLVESDTVARLCVSPLAKRLIGLRVPYEPKHLAALHRFPIDDRLQTFALRRPMGIGGAVSDRLRDGWGELPAVSFRPTIKRLDLAGCTVGDRGLATFARGDVWIRLRSLALDRNRFGDPGWRDFVRGRRTPELRTLTASRNFVTSDGAVRLGQSPLVETLEYVDLRGNRIDGKGAVALARSLRDGPLKKLLLAGNPLSAKDADAVRNVLGDRVAV